MPYIPVRNLIAFPCSPPKFVDHCTTIKPLRHFSSPDTFLSIMSPVTQATDQESRVFRHDYPGLMPTSDENLCGYPRAWAALRPTRCISSSFPGGSRSFKSAVVDTVEPRVLGIGPHPLESSRLKVHQRFHVYFDVSVDA